MSLDVLPTERPDAWEVHGRGELQLVVLLELMRREGYELAVSKPTVVTKEQGSAVLEPVEARRDLGGEPATLGAEGNDPAAGRPPVGKPPRLVERLIAVALDTAYCLLAIPF